MNRLSIVIPSYNMAHHLALTLDSLEALEAQDDTRVEVLVVDDGSSDETEAVVSRYRSRIPGLRSIFRPRDARSSRATARNLGVSSTHGERLLFLDAGVLVPPSLLLLCRSYFEDSSNVVLSFPVLGLLIDRPCDELELIRREKSDVAGLVLKLEHRAGWADPRAPFFDLCDGNLNQLPAPWTFCWTCALMLTRRLYEQAGAFDEGFRGWGSEDIDLGRRLQTNFADFRVESRLTMVHAPHPSSHDPKERAQSNRRNRARLHEKSRDLSSEVMTVISAIQANFLLQRLETTPLEYMFPVAFGYFSEAFGAVEERNVGVLGLTNSRALTQLRASHIFAHSTSSCRQLSRDFPDATVVSSLGISTPLETRELDTLVVTDFIRTLPAAVRKAQVAELTRIASEVLLVLTEDAAVLRSQEAWLSEGGVAELWPWVERDLVLADWEQGGCRIERKACLGATEVFSVRRSS